MQGAYDGIKCHEDGMTNPQKKKKSPSNAVMRGSAVAEAELIKWDQPLPGDPGGRFKDGSVNARALSVAIKSRNKALNGKHSNTLIRLNPCKKEKRLKYLLYKQCIYLGGHLSDFSDCREFEP